MVLFLIHSNTRNDFVQRTIYAYAYCMEYLGFGLVSVQEAAPDRPNSAAAQYHSVFLLFYNRLKLSASYFGWVWLELVFFFLFRFISLPTIECEESSCHQCNAKEAMSAREGHERRVIFATDYLLIWLMQNTRKLSFALAMAFFVV